LQIFLEDWVGSESDSTRRGEREQREAADALDVVLIVERTAISR